MQIFNTNYKEIGDLKQNLVLNTLGKVKIRYGNKFIDLLDNKGNIVSTNNTKVPQELTNIITEFQNSGIELSESQLLRLINKYIEGDEELGIEQQFKQLVPDLATKSLTSDYAEECNYAEECDTAQTARSAKETYIQKYHFECPTAQDHNRCYFFLITPNSKIWHIKYRIKITTAPHNDLTMIDSDCKGYYDCQMGFCGDTLVYRVFNECIDEYYPISNHILARGTSGFAVSPRIGIEFSNIQDQYTRILDIDLYEVIGCTVTENYLETLVSGYTINLIPATLGYKTI